jgi:hypothetical protein
MNISSSAAGSGGVNLHSLRDLLRMNGSGSAGQQVPGDGQGVGNSDPSTSSPSGPPPAGATLTSATLASLLDAQQTKPSASDIASQLISNADTDGDGSLSLDEITNALSGNQKKDPTQLSDAFNTLDSNGDGKLSSDELASGLQTMMQAHHHHGHGHGHAYGLYGQIAQNSATSTTEATTSTASIATTSTTSTTSSSTDPATTSTTPVDTTV